MLRMIKRVKCYFDSNDENVSDFVLDNRCLNPEVLKTVRRLGFDKEFFMGIQLIDDSYFFGESIYGLLSDISKDYDNDEKENVSM